MTRKKRKGEMTVEDTKESDNQTDSQKESPKREATKPAKVKIHPDLSHLPDPIFYDEYREPSSENIVDLTE